MSVKIRLRRVGATKRPSYRVVIADSHSPRDGAFVEIVGHYNPLADPTEFVVKADRIRYWLGQGAQPTERVERLLRNSGLLPAVATPAAKTESAPEAPVAAEE